MSIQEMAITVLMCRDERRAEFMRRLADRCFGGDIAQAESATVRLVMSAL